MLRVCAKLKSVDSQLVCGKVNSVLDMATVQWSWNIFLLELILRKGSLRSTLQHPFKKWVNTCERRQQLVVVAVPPAQVSWGGRRARGAKEERRVISQIFAETSTLGKFAAGNYQCYIEIVAIELYKHI